jgi:hypothetical protein
MTYSPRVCLECPLRALLLVGLPLPLVGLPLRRLHPSRGPGGPSTPTRTCSVRSEPDCEPRRCCLGFRFETTVGATQKVIRLEKPVSGISRSKPKRCNMWEVNSRVEQRSTRSRSDSASCSNSAVPIAPLDQSPGSPPVAFGSSSGGAIEPGNDLGRAGLFLLWGV